MSFATATDVDPDSISSGEGDASRGLHHWTRWLSQENYQVFIEELQDAATRNVDCGELQSLLDDWQATAELDHAPDLLIAFANARSRFLQTEEEWQRNRNTK